MAKSLRCVEERRRASNWRDSLCLLFSDPWQQVAGSGSGSQQAQFERFRVCCFSCFCGFRVYELRWGVRAGCTKYGLPYSRALSEYPTVVVGVVQLGALFSETHIWGSSKPYKP